MKRLNKKLVPLFIALMVTLSMAGVGAAAGYKDDYNAKVKQNNATIGVIAGVINYVCPRLVPDSTNICKPKDPVGSAVGVQKYMEKNWDREEDDIEDAEMPAGLKNKTAALQFWDAVEQFKLHYGYRATAKKLAGQGNWEEAFLNEEMAFQYLVKCASRGIFSKKLVDGE